MSMVPNDMITSYLPAFFFCKKKLYGFFCVLFILGFEFNLRLRDMLKFGQKIMRLRRGLPRK